MGRDWGPLALITQLGFAIVGAILLGVVLGLFVDRQFGTGPWGTLVLTIVGVIAGGVGAYRLVTDSIIEATQARQHRGDDQDPERGP